MVERQYLPNYENYTDTDALLKVTQQQMGVYDNTMTADTVVQVYNITM